MSDKAAGGLGKLSKAAAVALALLGGAGCTPTDVKPSTDNTKNPNTTLVVDNTVEIKNPSGSVSYGIGKKPQIVVKE